MADGDTVYTAVDAKRSRHRFGSWLANIEATPGPACWQTIMLTTGPNWWWSADGLATVHYSGEQMATGYGLLRAK